MRPTLTINTNLGEVILENQVAMMDDLIFPDTSISALTAHNEVTNPMEFYQRLVLDGHRQRQVLQDGDEPTVTVDSATEYRIPTPPIPTPTATATNCDGDSARHDSSVLDATPKVEVENNIVIANEKTTATIANDDSPVSQMDIAVALFKTVAAAAEQYSALKGLAAKYFVRCDKTDAPVGPKFDSMGYLILRDSHQFPIPGNRILETAEDRFKETGAKKLLELLPAKTDGAYADIDYNPYTHTPRSYSSDLVVVYTEDNHPVISSVQQLFIHSLMLREQLMNTSGTFHADRGLIREICLPLAEASALKSMFKMLRGQGVIARMLWRYDDQVIFDRLIQAWKVADTYGFHDCIITMLDCVLNYKPFRGDHAVWYTVAFCSAANKDNRFDEYFHKKIPLAVVSSDKTTYDFADSMCITDRTFRKCILCPPLAEKHLKTYVPELWDDLVVAGAQHTFAGVYDAFHGHAHDDHHDGQHPRGEGDSQNKTKSKCRHSPCVWEATRQIAADYMFDELVLRPLANTMWIYDVIEENLDGCVCGEIMYLDLEDIKRRHGGQIVFAMQALL